MIDFSSFYSRNEFRKWHSDFLSAIELRVDPKRHGDLNNWLDIVNSLPDIDADITYLDRDTVTIGSQNTLNEDTSKQLHQKILDVGCGSGYHCWRMLGDGANYVLGIDPSMRFLLQHMAIQKYAKNPNFDLLPIGIEDMPNSMPVFDSVFSMGVLYHRRNPINHILELKNLLSKGGELILETLIVDEIDGGVFTPDGRYAQMRNVWSIMTVEKIKQLMNEAGRATLHLSVAYL